MRAGAAVAAYLRVDVPQLHISQMHLYCRLLLISMRESTLDRESRWLGSAASEVLCGEVIRVNNKN